MSNFSVLKLEYSAYAEALVEALKSEDETAFFEAVDRIVQMREPGMLSEVRRLTGDLHGALERFGIESRLADIAENEMPGARARLTHVIKLTDEAAHRTLDLVEEAQPLAERTAREAGVLIESLESFRNKAPHAQGIEGLVRSLVTFLPLMRSLEAFLPAVKRDAEQVRRNLSDVLIAQGYQDLTGQIIRSVIKLADELERALEELTRLSGNMVEHAAIGDATANRRGPVIPGVTRGEVATDQSEVDQLLSSGQSG